MSNSADDNKKVTTVPVDSINYYTVLEGPENGPLAVLIHALMANHHIFDSTVTTLHNAGYQTLRYDHIGHNLTSAPSDPKLNRRGIFTFDHFCRHLNKIITTVSPDKTPAAIIGCSIGGVLSIRYHMLYPPPPGKTTKILSMAAPGLSTLPSSPQSWRLRVEQWRDDGHPRFLAEETVERWFPEPHPANYNPDVTRQMLETCTFNGYDICVWATMNFNYTGQLGKIKDGENVMVLAGGTDVNIGRREVLVDVSKRIVGSKYVLLEGVGHIPPMYPELFEPVMMDFLGPAEKQ